jgi:hypothetical protein
VLIVIHTAQSAPQANQMRPDFDFRTFLESLGMWLKMLQSFAQVVPV